MVALYILRLVYFLSNHSLRSLRVASTRRHTGRLVLQLLMRQIRLNSIDLHEGNSCWGPAGLWYLLFEHVNIVLKAAKGHKDYR